MKWFWKILIILSAAAAVAALLRPQPEHYVQVYDNDTEL